MANELTTLLPSNGLPKVADSNSKYRRRAVLWVCGLLGMSFIAGISAWTSWNNDTSVTQSAVWSSDLGPYSTIDPRHIGFKGISRSDTSKPRPVLRRLQEARQPLPTNSWCENLLLGLTTTSHFNQVFQVPYIVGTGGVISGIEVNGAHVMANDRQVMMTYEAENAVVLGAVSTFAQHEVVPYKSAARLSLVLEWNSGENSSMQQTGGMRSHIVRGSPYVTMEYVNSFPRLLGRRSMLRPARVDHIDGFKANTLSCGIGRGNFSSTPVTVHKEIELSFDVSDFTWIVFVSTPVQFVCSTSERPLPDPDLPPLPPGVLPDTPPEEAFFELRAVGSVLPGVVLRLALINNCTSGENNIHCEDKIPRNQTAYADLLRRHAEVFPTGRADVSFTFPSVQTPDENLELHFDWAPTSMAQWHDNLAASLASGGKGFDYDTVPGGPPVESADSMQVGSKQEAELLMFALPHHQDRLHRKVGSSNAVKSEGCVPTLHGIACPVTGGSWDLRETVHLVDYHASSPIRPEMEDDLRDAVRSDLKFRLPLNYQKGAGDTYFSGKMLARLGRVLIIAHQLGMHEYNHHDPYTSVLYSNALSHLRSSAEVWLNGSSLSPLVFDDSWGGLVGCGCDYDPATYGCRNTFPQCPALEDAGQNFGSGFYNDHHFHYGYHIYAAAVLAKLEPDWVRRHHEKVVTLIRDIANPSHEDPYFPTWRHKDWYLGSSWASGIVTLGGEPYPNGRNQESSAEAIAAYEAVALYGLGASSVYADSSDPLDKKLLDACQKIYAMGRVLLATEVRSAQRYWHVRSKNVTRFDRVYPEAYQAKVVGMLWSLLAQEQTWFGNEPWKSYGIQLLPITVASEARDDVAWVSEMLPIFEASCANDIACETEGWSVLVYASHATIGHWKEAWEGVMSLSDSSYDGAGGNGHSKSNTLWWIATRSDIPDYTKKY